MEKWLKIIKTTQNIEQTKGNHKNITNKSSTITIKWSKEWVLTKTNARTLGNPHRGRWGGGGAMPGNRHEFWINAPNRLTNCTRGGGVRPAPSIQNEWIKKRVPTGRRARSCEHGVELHLRKGKQLPEQGGEVILRHCCRAAEEPGKLSRHLSLRSAGSVQTRFGCARQLAMGARPGTTGIAAAGGMVTFCAILHIGRRRCGRDTDTSIMVHFRRSRHGSGFTQMLQARQRQRFAGMARRMAERSRLEGFRCRGWVWTTLSQKWLSVQLNPIL